MVVHINMSNKNKLNEKLNTKSSQIDMCDCNLAEKSDMDTPEYVFKNSTRTFKIPNGLGQPQKIGLNLNTRVHIKPKKTWDQRNCTSAVLFCLLIGQVILTYFESKHLRTELEVTRRQVDTLVESLLSANELYENIHRKLKEIEKISLKEQVETERVPEPVIKLNKRDVESQSVCHNCTDPSRQARSVNRGPVAVHLRGALAEITVRDGGIVAPWYVDKMSSGMFILTDGIVGEGRGIVEIVEEGLYFIYAQMYYLTSSSLNSYAINLQLQGGQGRENMVIAACSAEAATNKLSELSCFTAVVRYLHRGNRIFITQRERNRTIVFRDNKSFLGLTLLNAPHRYAH